MSVVVILLCFLSVQAFPANHNASLHPRACPPNNFFDCGGACIDLRLNDYHCVDSPSGPILAQGPAWLENAPKAPLLSSSVKSMGSGPRKFKLINNCKFEVWPALQGAGGTVPPFDGGIEGLSPGQSVTLNLPDPFLSGRIWPRTDCRQDQSGKVMCLTGDCGAQVNGYGIRCQGLSNRVPASLLEFSLSAAGGNDYYDLSNVDGFSIGLGLKVTGTKVDDKSIRPGFNCGSPVCNMDISTLCPKELQLKQGSRTVLCFGINAAVNDDIQRKLIPQFGSYYEDMNMRSLLGCSCPQCVGSFGCGDACSDVGYCCSNLDLRRTSTDPNTPLSRQGHGNVCLSSDWPKPLDSSFSNIGYDEVFKNACPDAYSWQFDDEASLFQCRNAEYELTFCPSEPSSHVNNDAKCLESPAFCLTDSEWKEIAKKHAPQFRFHPDESHWPISVADYFKNFDSLVTVEAMTVKSIETNELHYKPENIPIFTESASGIKTLLCVKGLDCIKGRISDGTARLKGEKPPSSKTPNPNWKLHTVINRQANDDQNIVDIHYWSFYGFNYVPDTPGMTLTNKDHPSDLVAIVIRFNATGVPLKIWYAQHGSGLVLDWNSKFAHDSEDEIPENKKANLGEAGFGVYGESHPIVYVSLGNHEHYTTVGDFNFQYVKNYDETRNGLIWNAEEQLDIIHATGNLKNSTVQRLYFTDLYKNNTVDSTRTSLARHRWMVFDGKLGFFKNDDVSSDCVKNCYALCPPGATCDCTGACKNDVDPDTQAGIGSITNQKNCLDSGDCFTREMELRIPQSDWNACMTNCQQSCGGSCTSACQEICSSVGCC